MTELDTKEYERKKSYLKRYRKNKALIDRLNKKIIHLDERITKIKSPSFSGTPRGGIPITLDDLLSDKLELEERIDRLKIKGKKLKRETIAIIDEVDDVRYADILESFFIDCKDFDSIADDTGYTERHIIRLYSEAINSVSVECQ